MASREEVFSNLKDKFLDWLPSRGVDGARNNYCEYLEAIGEPMQPHNTPTGKWFGMYEALTGERPKPIYSVTGVSDFAKNYGKGVAFYSVRTDFGVAKPRIRQLYPHATDFDFDALYAFAYTKGDNGQTRNGFTRYLEFLCELESQVDKASVSKVSFGGRLLQEIHYGAPGTGKSHKVNAIVSGLPREDVIRTTFHPDSDYSTFVGAYKPKIVECPRIVLENDKYQKAKFGDFSDNEKQMLEKERSIVYEFVPQAFAKAYVQAWKRLVMAKAIDVKICRPKDNPTGLDGVMKVAVDELIADHNGELGFLVTKDEIVAKFKQVPESNGYSETSILPPDYCYNRINDGLPDDKPTYFEFIEDNSYKCLGAGYKYNGDVWQRQRGRTKDQLVGCCVDGIRHLGGAAPVVLVIEEINRGDCAKIFGDLFQLLDRRVNDDEEDTTKKEGFSEYPVLADADFADFIRKELKDEKSKIEALGYGSVVADERLELMLPPNFYIWATMNTSDQSLFPMDSAFKRRWDWKYVPIAKPDHDGNSEWKERKIVANGNAYDWWEFITIINGWISKITNSEDKEIGYFFVKAPDSTGHISAESFANKVLFYLFYDVFKGWELPKDVFGKSDGTGKYVFKDFFYSQKTPDGDKTGSSRVLGKSS